jgi:hypothetical protein
MKDTYNMPDTPDTIEKQSTRWKWYIVSCIRFFLQICLGIISIIIVCVLILYMRLLWKPINLKFIQPFLEKIISSEDYAITLKNPNLVDTYDSSLFGVHTDTVSILNTHTNQKHQLTDVTVNISKTSLLKQQLGIKTIIINKGKLAPIDVFVDLNGLSSDTIGQDSDIKKNIQNTINHYVNMPLLKPLKSVIIKHIQLSVNNSGNKKQSFMFNIKALQLKRRNTINHVTVDIKSMFKNNDVNGRLNLDVNIDFNHDFIIKNIQSKIQFFDTHLSNMIIDNATITAEYNLKNPFADIKIDTFNSNMGTLTGNVSLFDTGDFKIDVLTNNIADGIFYTKPLGLQTIQAVGNIDTIHKALQIKSFALGFPEDLAIKGSAAFDFKNGFDKFLYHLNADIYHLNLPKLLALWPNIAAVGAKDWILENMTEVIFDTSDVHISGLNTDAYPKVSLNAPVSDATFSYLKPMPPATHATGRLLINDKTFIAQLDSAKIGVLNVKQASLKIPDIMAQIPWGYATARMNGALKPLLRVIDGKPLQLMSKGHFGYKHTIGNFDGILTMDLPLLKNVKLKEITMVSDVHIDNGSLRVGKKQLPLEKIDADLHITADTAKGSGSVNVYGIHNQFDWRENFNMRADVTTDLTLKTAVNETQIQKLITQFSSSKVSVSEYAKGTALLNTHLQLQNDNVKLLTLKGNAKNMRLGDVNSVLTMPQGSKKTVTLRAKQNKNQFLIQDFKFDNHKNTAYFTDIVIDNNGIRSAKIDNVTFKNCIKNLSGNYHIAQKRHFLTLNAEVLSVSKIMDNQDKGTPTDTETRYFNTDKTMTEYPNIVAHIAIKNLGISDNVNIDDVDIAAERDIHNQHIAYIDIETPMIDATHITLQERAWNKRSMTVTTHNAGSFITETGIFKSFKKGHLTADIIQTPHRIAGNVSIDKGTLLKSPWIAKLLSLASLTGILDRLNNRGLSIDNTTLDFTKKNDMIHFKNGLIAGSAIGISFQGDHRLDNDTMNFYGALMPFYGINSLLSDIPIVGHITSSRQSEGMIALSYHITGNSENPDVSVNPLSVFGVGILRRLFE